MMLEQPVCFPCDGDVLVGIVTPPPAGVAPVSLGVLVVVGGPQYRAGSHRQFVLLARRLAMAGIPVMRFDLRGMGDSTGTFRDFLAIHDDIDAALGAFQQACPALQGVVLWGLCDAASAALLYWQERRDPRIAGLALLNPWVRSEAGLARARVRHYYRQRLLQPAFWKKLLAGKLALGAALGDSLRNWRQARRGTPVDSNSFQSHMAAALRDYPGPLLCLLSGRDLTAQEFDDWTGTTFPDRGWPVRPEWVCQTIADADHTFSRADWRQAVESATANWVLAAAARRSC